MEKTIYQDNYISIVEDTYESGTLTFTDSSLYGGRTHVLVSNGMTRYWLYNSDKSAQYSHSDSDTKYGYKSISKPSEGVVRLEFSDGRWYFIDVFGKPLNKIPFTCASDFLNGFAVVDAMNGFGGSLLDHAGNLFLKSDSNKIIKVPEGFRTGYFIDDNHIALQEVYSHYFGLFDNDLNPIVQHDRNGDHQITFETVEKGPLDWCVYFTECSCYPNQSIRDEKSLYNLFTKQICYHKRKQWDSYHKGTESSFAAIGENCVVSKCVVNREDKEWDSDEHEYNYDSNHYTQETFCFKNGNVFSFICEVNLCPDKQLIIIQGCEYIKSNSKELSKFGCLSYSGHIIVPVIYTDLKQIDDRIEVTFDDSTYLYNLNGSIIYQNTLFLPKGIHAFEEYGSGRLLVKKYVGVWQELFLYGVFDTHTREYLLPIEYSSFKECENQTFIVCRNSKYGIVDKDFNIVIDCKYETFEYVSDGVYICSIQKEGGKYYGIIDIDESFIVDATYYSISFDGLDRIHFKTLYDYLTESREFYTDKNLNTLAQSSDNGEIKMNGFWNLSGSFIGDYCIFKDDKNKNGIVNIQSDVVISPRYDSIQKIGNADLYIGAYNESYYLINPVNRSEKPIKGIRHWVDKDVIPLGYIYFSDGNKVGLINSNGDSIIDCDYTSISVFESGIRLEKGDFVGNADIDGNIIIPCEYLDYHRLDNGYYIANNKYSYILSPYGTPVISGTKHYNSILETKANCLKTVSINSDGERHYGLVTKRGRVLKEPELSYVGEFVNGTAVFNQGGTNKLRYNNTKRTKELHLEGGKFGLINEMGNIVVDSKYDYISKAVSGYHIVAIKTDSVPLFGIIDSTGAIIVSCKYSYVRNVAENMIVFALGGEWHSSGWDKEKLSVPKFNGDKVFLHGAKWGILDISENIIMDAFADYMRIISEGKVTYKLGGKYGVIDLKTRETHISNYVYLSAFHEGRCIAGALDSQNHLRYGYINEDYAEIVPCEYSKAYHYSNGEGCLENGYTKYYFDPDGTIIRDESDDYSYDSNDNYDWERETWYALTDGQYGDYPGPGVDYDFLGL